MEERLQGDRHLCFHRRCSYTEEVKSKTIYSDLGLGETTKADVIVDGKTAADFTVKKGDDTKLEASGNGVLVEAFVDSDDNVTLVVINTYVGEVSKVVDADSVKKDEEPTSRSPA